MTHAHHHHAHDHDHAHHGAGSRHLLFALLLTGGFMTVEAVAGLLSGSLALLADAGHMLTDTAALGLAWLALHLSRKPASTRLSYGHQRWPVLAAFVNGLTLWLLAAWILIEAVQRLWQPPEVQALMVVWVALIGLVVNLLAFAVLSRGEQNLNTRGALVHVLGDLLGSVAALAAGLIIHFSDWLLADPLLSILVALLMLRSGWPVLKQSTHMLLEGTPAHLDTEALAQRLVAALPGIASVHHLHAWSLNDRETVITLHARLHESADADAQRQAIQQLLHDEFGIQHSTVQIEGSDCSSESCA